MAAIEFKGVLPEPCKVEIGPLDCIKRGFELGKDQYWMQFLIAMIGIYFVHAATMGLLIGPFLCSIFIMLFDKMRGEKIVIDHLVRGVDCIWGALLASLALWITLAIVSVPFILLSLAHFIFLIRALMNEATALNAGLIAELVLFGLAMQAGILLCTATVYVGFAFVFPLIAEYNPPFTMALKTGLRAAWMNLVEITTLLVLLALIFFTVSFVTCGLGGFFYLPFAFAAMAAAHRKVFPDPTERNQNSEFNSEHYILNSEL
ncbi:hypothetical protein JXA32_17425 [Candidatus Sumerlaeota bacterium]|nr:hypothetical protein [Candidatus Sumerlaeota bacterium]